MYKFNRKIGKKGNLFDQITAAQWIFGIFITLFFVWAINDGFNDAISINPIFNGTGLVEYQDNYNTTHTNAWDLGVLILAIFLPLFSVIAARKIPSSTTFMVLAWLILGFIFLAMMIMSNIYGMMIEDATISQFVATTRFIPLIMPNLPYYGMIYTFLVVVALYTKRE